MSVLLTKSEIIIYIIGLEKFILDLIYTMGFIPENQNDTKKATSSTSNGGSSSLRTRNDCKIIAPLSRQSFFYNGNVVIQELADGEVLTYDKTTSKWMNLL